MQFPLNHAVRAVTVFREYHDNSWARVSLGPIISPSVSKCEVATRIPGAQFGTVEIRQVMEVDGLPEPVGTRINQ